MDEPDNLTSSLIGLPPGSLLYIGDNTSVPVSLTCFYFETGNLTSHAPDETDELLEELKRGRRLWIHMTGLHNASLVARLGQAAGYSTLHLEDTLNSDHSPKFDFDETGAIILIKTLLPETEGDGYVEDHFCVLFNNSSVLSFQESEHRIINPIYQRMKIADSRIRRHGNDYLAYALLDTVADSLVENVRIMRDDIEELDDEFQDVPSDEVQNRIHAMRGGLSELRKGVWPFRDAVAKMISTDFRGIDKKTIPYLRDTQDHLNTCSMIIDSNREMLANMREWHLAEISARLNEVMKVLTIISTIFIPLTFLAGIYGMNFHHMPELNVPWAYPALLGLMGVIAILMIIFFWRRKWF